MAVRWARRAGSEAATNMIVNFHNLDYFALTCPGRGTSHQRKHIPQIKFNTVDAAMYSQLVGPHVCVTNGGTIP